MSKITNLEANEEFYLVGNESDHIQFALQKGSGVVYSFDPNHEGKALYLSKNIETLFCFSLLYTECKEKIINPKELLDVIALEDPQFMDSVLGENFRELENT